LTCQRYKQSFGGTVCSLISYRRFGQPIVPIFRVQKSRNQACKTNEPTNQPTKERTEGVPRSV